MHSGDKPTTTQPLHICNTPKWPYRRPRRVPTTLAPTHTPVNGDFFILNRSGNKIVKPAHDVSATGANGQPTQYRPLPPCRRRGSTFLCFHVSATSSVGAKRLQRCCRDMELYFCGFYVGASPPYHPPTPPHQPRHIRGTGSATTRGWATTTTWFPRPCNPPATARLLEQTHTAPTPPAPQDFDEKKQKHRRRCQNALRRFLVTPATIGRIYAPGFNCANPQGVTLDSLGGFKFSGAVQGVDTPALRAFLSAQRQQLN